MAATLSETEASALSKPVDSLAEKWKLLPAFLATRGLVRQHVESFNHFVEKEIKEIVEANQFVRLEPNLGTIIVSNVRVEKPSINESMTETPIWPHQCRLRDLTYSAPIIVDMAFKKPPPHNDVKHFSRIEIGRLPIMLRSSRCLLHGQSDAALAAMQECPYDPGGYFVVKGVEKVVLTQEQLSKNRIIVELDPKGAVSSSVTSSTHERKSRTVITSKGEKLQLRHSSIGDEVPVAVVMRAMGATSDLEMTQLVGSEPAVQRAFVPCLEEARELGVFTQAQALDFIGARIRARRASSAMAASRSSSSSSYSTNTRAEEAANVLAGVVLSHVPASGLDLGPKRIFLALMVRRVLLTQLGRLELDDKDYYGNKRLELAGQLISLLFEDLFKRLCSDIRRIAEKLLVRSKSSSQWIDVRGCVHSDIITSGMQSALSTGNWTLKRFRMERAGVTQQLSRLSYISALGMMTRVTSQFEKTRKVSGPRALQPSQWGMLCPSDTPEGEACGLVKNLALLAHVTTDADADPVERICFSLGVEDAALLMGEALHAGLYLVFLNGIPLGGHNDPHRLAGRLRRLRRAGRLGQFVSVHVHDGHRTVSIATDGGRVCRPLIIVEGGRPLLTATHLHQLERGATDFDSLLLDGVLEYLDVNEENNSRVALREQDVDKTTTHLEIDPVTVLGVVAGTIPYPHHNQSPRNTYQCAMGKQAMGTIGLNQQERVDTVLYLMVYPQKPMVRTRVLDMIRFDDIPAGQNAIIAVMSYSGYDIEDAIVLNRASLDRGYGRCIVMKKFATTLRKYPNGTMDRIAAPPEDLSAHQELWRTRLAHIEADGIVGVGSRKASGGFLVNKQQPSNTLESAEVRDQKPHELYRNAPLTYKGAESAIVDRVMVASTTGDITMIKVSMRQVRRPELGDKFSSRHGQKGVCGLIAPQRDLPFTDEGIVPDMIMNPHGFPSRMTVGKMIELIAGKAGVQDGYRRYGTAFGGDKVEDIAAALVQRGYHFGGKEVLTSGVTGLPLPGYVFFGPMYYQKLKHMVMDKMHARARGPRATLTRQPTEGRSRDGGLRLGEMERDCLIGYGASMLLVERLMLSSDVFEADVCASEQCGGLLAFRGWCQSCKSSTHVRKVRMPYACKLLFQELMSMNICPRLNLEPN